MTSSAEERSEAAAAACQVVRDRGLASIVVVADGERAALAVDGLGFRDAAKTLRHFARELEMAGPKGRRKRRRNLRRAK